MSKKTKKRWGLMVSKIQKIENLRRKIEEDESFDFEELSGIIEKPLSGRIMNNLIEVESFLREVIKEVEK